jgi:hypothetical protein
MKRAVRVDILPIEARATKEIHRVPASMRRLPHQRAILELPQRGALIGLRQTIQWHDRLRRSIAGRRNGPDREPDCEEAPAGATDPSVRQRVEVGRAPAPARAHDVESAAVRTLQAERRHAGEDGGARWGD